MSLIRIALFSTTLATAALVGCNKPAYNDGESARQAETWNGRDGRGYQAPGAPAGSYANNEVRVTDIDLGRSLDGKGGIGDKTREFKSNDTVYASIDTKGVSAGTRVNAVFKYEDGQVIHSDSVVIAADGKEKTEFHISQPGGLPEGDYEIEITVGDKVKSQKFKIDN